MKLSERKQDHLKARVDAFLAWWKDQPGGDGENLKPPPSTLIGVEGLVAGVEFEIEVQCVVHGS